MTPAQQIIEICKTAYNHKNGTPNDKTTNAYHEIVRIAKDAGFPVWAITDHYKYCLLVNLLNIENYAKKVDQSQA